MLTDMGPTAGQFYGSQIPTMGMNITNITNHIQKPNMNSVSKFSFFSVYNEQKNCGNLLTNSFYQCMYTQLIFLTLQVMYIFLSIWFKYQSPEVIG